MIISSKDKDPSHFSLKSRGSRCCEYVSDMEWAASGYRFTYVVMHHESTQCQPVGLIVAMMELTGLFMRQSKLDKVR